MEGPEQSRGRGGLFFGSVELEEMDEAECWDRLRAHNLGRLGLVVGAEPLILPVNYSAGDHAIVFRTAPGTKLEHGPGSIGCFEIDGFDERTGFGWSVLVTGPISAVPEDDTLRRLPVHPLAPGKRRDYWLALRSWRISGRRFRAGWAST